MCLSGILTPVLESNIYQHVLFGHLFIRGIKGAIATAFNFLVLNVTGLNHGLHSVTGLFTKEEAHIVCAAVKSFSFVSNVFFLYYS